MPIDIAEAAAAVNELRARRPLVHNITNYVAMTISANVLLAVGASPASGRPSSVAMPARS